MIMDKTANEMQPLFKCGKFPKWDIKAFKWSKMPEWKIKELKWNKMPKW
jgi:hypothetical protein